MQKKILVTGANGLLGQKLVYALKENNNYKLVATARGENRLVDKGFVYVPMDITSKENVEKVMSEYLPDIIIHTAAMTMVDDCEEKKEECWNANVNAVKYLVDAAKKSQAHFIHVSTDFIFDGTQGPYSEEASPNPISYYGESKLAAEKIVKNYPYKWAILRTSLLYGMVDNMSRSNIVLWVKNELKKGKAVNMVNDHFRTPTLVEDLAQGCLLAAEKSAQGVYNISGKEYMSIIEIAQKVADYYNLDKSLILPISSKTLNQKANRPPVTGFIIDKAINDLNYHPHTFEQGIAILEEQFKTINPSLF